MPKQDTIILEAVGEFPFTFYIEKAEPVQDQGDLIIEGVASTTNIDHDNERMSEEALRSMEAAINNDGVPLRVEHHKEDNAIIGKVFKAWVDERKQLHVRARLDKSHPVSSVLHHAMKTGTKMGLSVGGLVKRAMKELSESSGKMVKTFFDVALQEVSVTPRPANYDAWVVAKSIARDMHEAEQYSDNIALRREFLLENSQLDYLQAFAKSVPDKAWRKVESPNIINKQDDNNMKESKTGDESTETQTEKAVSRAEFNSLSKSFKDLATIVTKGFENVSAILNKAMDSDAKDATNPDKKKPEDESATAKAEETETSETEKAEETTEDETSKAEETEGSDTDATREKTSTSESEADTYDMETVTRSIKTLDALNKRLKGVKKAEAETTEDETSKAEETETSETEKAEETETTETEKAEEDETTETTKHVHPLDLLVVKMTETMENIVSKMEKSGKRVLGFEKSFVEDIQNSPTIQREIQKMMKIPGQKKSVVMGVPVMVTKEGKRYELVAKSIGEVQKSEKSDQPKDFRSMYKTRYSSVSAPEQQ